MKTITINIDIDQAIAWNETHNVRSIISGSELLTAVTYCGYSRAKIATLINDAVDEFIVNHEPQCILLWS